MCIVIISCPFRDVTIFEINDSFLIKLFFYITKKSGQNCKYLKNKKSFKHEIKSIFHHFLKGFQNWQRLFQTWEWAFKYVLKSLQEQFWGINFLWILWNCLLKAFCLIFMVTISRNLGPRYVILFIPWLTLFTKATLKSHWCRKL